jgi:tRNA-2-methylthio-N6-dimethylallyladenosine synthase
MNISGKKFHLVTFGCQMNEYDTVIMRSVLTDRGMAETEDEKDADLILVNTCAVRDGAEERAFGRLNSFKPLKRQKDRDVLIGMTGCVAQEHGKKVLERLPFLDMIVGTRDILKIGNLAEQAWSTGDRFVAVDDIDLPLPLPTHVVDRDRPLKAMVTIMLGCDKVCTYCIVPKTRGKEWSRPAAEVLEECGKLIAHGYKEIMLLGQNVNSYRGETTDGVVTDFPDLLRALDALGAKMEAAGEGSLERIRFTTSHPIDASDKLWEAMRDCPRVCDQLHLPVQSGSDRVLRKMKRLYKRAEYLERVASLRRHVPNVTLTTDIIVGFCGESDEDFEETMSLVREVRYDQAFMFMYSPRAGTPSAEHLPDDVPQEVKKERLQRLIDLQEGMAAEFNAAKSGTVERVLVEGPAKRPEGWMMGRTEGDVVVNFAGDADLVGRVVDVRITETSAHTLRGEMVEQPAGSRA